MNLLYRLFKRDPGRREDVIAVTSGLGIAVSVLTAAVKIVIGSAAASVAIISEGVNNATDALNATLTLLGIRLAKMKPDRKHPFGYGRIEYLTSLSVSVLILVTGIEILAEAAKRIRSPEDMSVTPVILLIVAVSMVIKFFLGSYTIRMGRKTGSDALVLVGQECRNDSFISLLTILSSGIFLIFHVSLDAYAGLVMGALVIKAGALTLVKTLSEIIGRPGEEKLASDLYREIRGTEGILGAADMMLHNYGPESYSGSVNIELDHKLTMGEAYRLVHTLQLRILKEYRVTMVFGLYAVDNDNKDARELRKLIGSFVKDTPHVLGFHALFPDPDESVLYCDLVVDYDLKDWGALEDAFSKYINAKFPDFEVCLTVETEYV